MTDSEPVQLTLAGDEKPRTRYTFVSTDTGCLVQRIGGLECEVKYEDTYLYINGQPCGVYVYRKALTMLAETFTDWVRPGGSRPDRDECCEMIERALNSRFFAQWKRIVKYIAPPEVEELSRKMFHSVMDDAAILHFPALYTDEWKHLRSDLKKYHACRMYAKHCEGETNNVGIVSLMDDTPLDQQILLGNAAAWRERLTPAVPYKALNKTLDSISWGISWKHLHRLSTMCLEKPITTRLHLAFALAASDHHNWGLHERIVLNASDQAVIDAGEVMGWTITARTRKDDLERFSHRILDYPEAYGGDLVGLARRSHEWHEQMLVRVRLFDGDDRPDSLGSLSADAPLPLLPFDYDKLAEQGITPLRTAGDCYHEHEVMRHCVHTYATKAQQGLCHLFHVEYDYKDEQGNVHHEQATIEMLPDGEIGQAEGPQNGKNKACTHGIVVLRRAYGMLVKGQVL